MSLHRASNSALNRDLVAYVVSEDGRTVGGPTLARVSDDGATVSVHIAEPITVHESGNHIVVFYSAEGERWLECDPTYAPAGGTLTIANL